MQLVNLKNQSDNVEAENFMDSSRKELGLPTSSEGGVYPEEPEYPCGLKLYLDEDVIKKLGLEELPAIGEEIMIEGKVSVCMVSSNESKEMGLMRSLELQITELGLERKKDANKLAKKLYG